MVIDKRLGANTQAPAKPERGQHQQFHQIVAAQQHTRTSTNHHGQQGQ